MTTPKRRPFDYSEIVDLIQSGFDQGGVACEFCDADLALIDTGGHVFVLEVRHDDDCPLLLAIYDKD
jgi:hypothetical protein